MPGNVQDPKFVGAQIRALLLSLSAPDHTEEEEAHGISNHSTDELRREALDHAGICWLAPGEMAPSCACEWSPERPGGPREALRLRLKL